MPQERITEIFGNPFVQKGIDIYICGTLYSKLTLKTKEKFGVSSEKVNSDQLYLFDLFNDAETL